METGICSTRYVQTRNWDQSCSGPALNKLGNDPVWKQSVGKFPFKKNVFEHMGGWWKKGFIYFCRMEKVLLDFGYDMESYIEDVEYLMDYNYIELIK